VCFVFQRISLATAVDLLSFGVVQPCLRYYETGLIVLNSR
jgi:hypothetical protein